MKHFRVYLLLFIPLLIGSCKTDVDINAHWKDITIVYGLLNQSDTAQYIRINKAFLGEGNALQMANIADSSLYDTAVIQVKLIELNNGIARDSAMLYPVTEIQKDSGMFYYPSQILYKTKFHLNSRYGYKLEIKNKKTGKIISAQTNLVEDFDVAKPSWSSKTISFISPGLGSYKVEWTSAKNAKRYEVLIRFHYREKSEHSSDTLNKYVDWNLGSIKSDDLLGGVQMYLPYEGTTFYTNMEAAIQNKNFDPTAKRFIGKVEFIFYAAGNELNTYIEVNGPYSGILQEKPEYTNIENGIGIFSSRYYKSKSFSLSTLSLDTLRARSSRFHLNFQ